MDSRSPHRVNILSRMLIMDKVIKLIATISSHLLWRSWTMIKYFWLWGASGTSPKMSTCSWCHGFSGHNLGWRGAGRGSPAFLLRTHASQFFTNCSMRVSIPGYQTESRHFRFILTIPGCRDASLAAVVLFGSPRRCHRWDNLHQRWIAHVKSCSRVGAPLWFVEASPFGGICTVFAEFHPVGILIWAHREWLNLQLYLQ